MSKIRVVYKRPGKHAEIIHVDNTLEEFQRLLDGGYLEGVRVLQDVHAYIDEEGRLKSLPFNFLLPAVGTIVGPAVFSKVDAEGEDTGFESFGGTDHGPREEEAQDGRRDPRRGACIPGEPLEVRPSQGGAVVVPAPHHGRGAGRRDRRAAPSQGKTVPSAGVSMVLRCTI